jgi:fructokinase
LEAVKLERAACLHKKKIEHRSYSNDPLHKTRKRIVKLDDKGSASYTINYPVAWDKIECNPEIEDLVKKAAAFYLQSY